MKRLIQNQWMEVSKINLKYWMHDLRIISLSETNIGESFRDSSHFKNVCFYLTLNAKSEITNIAHSSILN